MEISENTIICSKCQKEAKLWKIDSLDGSEPDLFYFCDDHAQEFGFCLGCGHFLAGVEYYEFSEVYKYGYCHECWTDLWLELEGNHNNEDEECYF